MLLKSDLVKLVFYKMTDANGLASEWLELLLSVFWHFLRVFHSYFGQVVTLKGVSWSCFYRQDALSISFANIFWAIASSVLTVIGLVNGRWQFSTHHRIHTP